MNIRRFAGGFLFVGLLYFFSADGAIRVYVQDQGGWAWLRYACTGGEVVRGFAVNVTLDRGVIVGVTNFFVGPSRVGATGYGIFPASFRDTIVLQGGIVPDWSSPGYSPVAVAGDLASDTLPGLGSPGVTLEFAALWDPQQPLAIPAASGVLCALIPSQPAQFSVTANPGRGGVVVVNSDVDPVPVFSGGAVGPLITSSVVSSGTLYVTFHGGEMQTGPSIDGPWTDTGNISGAYSESTSHIPFARFYRVHSR